MIPSFSRNPQIGGKYLYNNWRTNTSCFENIAEEWKRCEHVTTGIYSDFRRAAIPITISCYLNSTTDIRTIGKETPVGNSNIPTNKSLPREFMRNNHLINGAVVDRLTAIKIRPLPLDVAVIPFSFTHIHKVGLNLQYQASSKGGPREKAS